MGCFSGSTKGQSVQQVNKLTPAQQKLVEQLIGKAGPAIAGVGGATIPGDDLSPAGPGELQNQAFGLPGYEQSQNAFNQSIQPFSGQQFTEQVGQPLADFANRNFQERTLPAISGAAGAQGTARSSGFQDKLIQSGENLNLGLNAQLAPQAYGAQQAALGRQFNAPQANLGATGKMLNIGGQQQGFAGQQREFDLQRFLQAAPESDPRLGFIGPAFTSSFDTAVQQGFYAPGLGTQLLEAAGSAASGTNFNSDERIKDNIIPITDALKKIKTLDGKTYNYIANNLHIRDGGVIAQDLEKILPEAVSERGGIKYVKYDAVIALVVNAVKQLADQVEDLRKAG